MVRSFVSQLNPFHWRTPSDPMDVAPAEGLTRDKFPLEAAIERGCRRLGISAAEVSGNKSLEPDRNTVAFAGKLVERAKVDGSTTAALSEILELVERFPASERLQILAARLIETIGDGYNPSATWSGVLERFPRCQEAMRLHLRWTARNRGLIVAEDLLQRLFPTIPDDLETILTYAGACLEIKRTDLADEGYARAIHMHPDEPKGYVAYATALRKRGLLVKAAQIAATGTSRLGAVPALDKLTAQLKSEIVIARGADTDFTDESVVGVSVLRTILREISAVRQALPDAHRSFLGPVIMISGSLGAGGAERQLTNTSVGLQSHIDRAMSLAGYDVVGPVEIFVRSLTSRAGGDFFLQELKRARVDVTEYSTFDRFGGNSVLSVAGQYAERLKHVAPQLSDGTMRLADALTLRKPDVVHIWQDGSVLTSGLAALLAGVPKIILSVRSMPPIDRPERMKPEYAVLYSEMLRMPGVCLSANSYFTAVRYAEWLKLDPSAIAVIHNGLEPLTTNADPETTAKALAFDALTEGYDFTVGSVMRFDDNKRPLLWIEAAQQLLERRPHARFIVAGDGPLLPEAKELASRLGIAHRILFVGRSSAIGYWLSRFDTFLLLSIFEGLPNVLIEAQLAGVPVFTTPAGGASETVLEGVTGHVFESEDISAEEIADWLFAYADQGLDRRSEVAERANEWGRSNFSVNRMLDRTMDTYMS